MLVCAHNSWWFVRTFCHNLGWETGAARGECFLEVHRNVFRKSFTGTRFALEAGAAPIATGLIYQLKS